MVRAKKIVVRVHLSQTPKSDQDRHLQLDTKSVTIVRESTTPVILSVGRTYKHSRRASNELSHTLSHECHLQQSLFYLSSHRAPAPLRCPPLSSGLDVAQNSGLAGFLLFGLARFGSCSSVGQRLVGRAAMRGEGGEDVSI